MENIEIKSDKELLKKFVLELSSQLQNNKIHIDEIKGVATVQGTKGGKIFSFSIEQKELARSDVSKMSDKFARKSDYKEEIKRLYQSGLKQTEIAHKLNMSQSSVSKLLNDEY